MEIKIDKQVRLHLNYFLSIEKDFEKLSRYIEFAEDNYETYSIELAKFIMTSTQEVDVIMKELYLLIEKNNPKKKKDAGIEDYKQAVVNNLAELIQEEVYISKFQISAKPWIAWSNNDEKIPHPLWWTANNKIKHHRADFFKEKANLENAFNAIGGLLITIVYYCKKKYELEHKRNYLARSHK